MIVAFITSILTAVLLSLGMGGLVSVLALHIGFVPDLGYWEGVFLYLLTHLLLAPARGDADK